MDIRESQVSRARGCLLGQLAGDSLGSLVEFRDAGEIRGQYPSGVRQLAGGGVWRTLAGQPTDDSELALMLARSLAAMGRYDEEDVAQAYVRWYASNPFDCGGTISKALSVAKNAPNEIQRVQWAREAASITSQANGALMRISPLGIFGHALAPEPLADFARRDATLTHPHQVCQDASAVFCVSIARAIETGEDGAAIHAFAREWSHAAKLHPDVIEYVEQARSETPDDFSENMGWVRIALQNAFFQLCNAPSLEEGVIATVMRGGDTDTNAAIAGALLGAVQGEQAIPAQWRNSILQCRPQAGEPGVFRPRPREFWPVDAIELADQLFVAREQLKGN